MCAVLTSACGGALAQTQSEGSAPPESRLALTLAAPPLPLRLVNKDPSGQLARLKLGLGPQKSEITLKAEGSCPALKEATNISETGVYLSQMRVGFGSAGDSYWTGFLYEGTDRSEIKRSETVTMPLDLSLLKGSVHDSDPALLLRAKGGGYAAGSEEQLAFFQKDQRFDLKIPVRLEVVCQRYVHDKVRNKTQLLEKWSRVTSEEMSVAVQYKGNAKLKRSIIQPLKLRNVSSGGTETLRPFRVGSLAIIAGPQNLRGACPMSAVFKLRIEGEGAGRFRLVVKSGNETQLISDEVAFTAPKQELSFSLLVSGDTKKELYTQQLGKITVELQGKPARAQNTKLYSVREKTKPYLWQYSCTGQ